VVGPLRVVPSQRLGDLSDDGNSQFLFTAHDLPREGDLFGFRELEDEGGVVGLAEELEV
jgi:hypothetical protein